MTEWGMDPITVINTWTDELLDLMLEKLIQRKRREAKAMESTGSREREIPQKFMSLHEFAKKISKED